MARSAVRLLLLAIVLAAIHFHPGAVVEGKDAPARPEGDVHNRCGACEVTRLYVAAYSPVNKVPAISETIGIADNVCKEMADDVLLVLQDGGSCNENCKTSIRSGLREAIKHYKGLVDLLIKEKRCSIQRLKDYICEEGSAGEDGYNESKFETWMKHMGRMLKKLGQKESGANLKKACEKLNAALK